MMKKTNSKSSSLSKEKDYRRTEQRLQELAKQEKKIDSIFQFSKEAMMKCFSK